MSIKFHPVFNTPQRFRSAPRHSEPSVPGPCSVHDPCSLRHTHTDLILDLGQAREPQAHRRKGTFHQHGWQISKLFKRGRKPDTTRLLQLLLTPTNCLLHNRRKMLPLSPSQVFPCVLHAQALSSQPHWGASFISRER